MLSDRCLSCLSVCLFCPVCMSEMLVYCGQMVGWIKMPRGREVGLHPSNIVLDGDPSSIPKKGAEPPIFGPCLLWPNGWMDQDATWHGSRPRPGPGHIVLDGDPAPPPPKSGHRPQFTAHVYCSQMAGWIKMPLGTKVGLGPGHSVLHGDPSLPTPLLQKGAQPPPNFWLMSIVAKRSPISATAEHLLFLC